jgi:hypothetical protein
MRSLTKEEINQLSAQGNTASDWNSVHVHRDFIPDHINGNSFFNECYLGVFTGQPLLIDNALSLPSGIYNSTVSDTVISSHCCIRNAGSIHHYYLADSVILHNNGTMTCTPKATFGNGTEIIIGNETGGRTTHAFADITFELAREICLYRKHLEEYLRFIMTYAGILESGFGIIGTGARIVNCGRISNAIIGPGAVCNNATLIENSSIMCSSGDPVFITDGAYVRSSCLQPGSSVSSMAIVDTSVLVEHSHVERHAKVTGSIIGPNTGIAEGEITASFVGPFVGFHHQALLIGTLWPEGKGNIAYGANIGSNHTGKAPDQELYCGEGLFFGLGTSCKFPADFSRAPYTIIATGCTTSPQCCIFPFSLITAPSSPMESVPAHCNELLPGWMLSDNMYALKRNELKFLSRNKAKRTSVASAIFRPEIIDMVIGARDTLKNVTTEKPLYLETDIQGIGSNFISRKNVGKAITTYTGCIEHYCLEAVYLRCRECAENGKELSKKNILSTSSAIEHWQHVTTVMKNEAIGLSRLQDALDRYHELVEKILHDVVFSKKKDDLRGGRIMRDYHLSHIEVSADPVVQELVKKSGEIAEQTTAMKKLISSE